MKAIFFLALAVTLAACNVSPHGPQAGPAGGTGDELGNGGDLRPELFQDGRPKAVAIVRLVPELKVEDFPEGQPELTEEVRSFYSREHAEIIKDIEKTPRYRWKKFNDNGACGETGHSRYAPVTWSYEYCGPVVHTDTDAAIFIVGESAHHFNVKNDAFPAHLRVGLRRAYHRILGLGQDQVRRRAFFEQARYLAAEAFFQVELPGRLRQPGQVTEVPPGTQTPDTLDLRYFFLERDNLGKRLLKLRLEGVDGLPKSDVPYATCARLSPTQKDLLEFNLSKNGCDTSSFSTLEGVQIMLFIAILEHSGNRIVESLRLANRIAAGWLRTYSGSSAQWTKVPEPEGDTRPFRSGSALWTGQEVVAWSSGRNPGTIELHYLNPFRNTWRTKVTDNSYLEFFNQYLSVSRDSEIHRPAYVQERLVAYTECHSGWNARGSGIVYEPSTNKWRPMTRDGAPDRRRAVVLEAGNRLLVWGGDACVGIALPLPMTDGYFYSPSEDKWTPIPPASFLGPREGISAAWANGKLYVWGGCDYYGRRCFQSGGVYDPNAKDQSWTPLPVRGAPSARGNAIMVPAGDYLVVTMGVDENGQVPFGGARFNMKHHRWEPMQDAPIPANSVPRRRRLIAPHMAIHAPPRGVAVLGAPNMFYDPERDEWTTRTGSFSPREARNLLWTGSEILLWSGLPEHIYTLAP